MKVFLRATLLGACLMSAVPARSQGFDGPFVRCLPLLYEVRLRMAEACGTPDVGEPQARVGRMIEARRAGIESTKGPAVAREWLDRVRRVFAPRREEATPENCAALTPHFMGLINLLNSPIGEDLERRVELDAKTSPDPLDEPCK